MSADNTQDNIKCKDNDDVIKDKESPSEAESKEFMEITHHELVKLTKEAISNIIKCDPLLCELPLDVTLDEIKAQVAVAQGQAITLYINRGELPKLAVVVPPHNTSVLELKKAIKRHMSLCLKRENVKKKISWKHIWRKYHLCFQNVRLTNDEENIKAYGIANKSELYYVKRRREKNKFAGNK